MGVFLTAMLWLPCFGKVEDFTLEAGFHVKSPFQEIILMDNREQKTPFSTQAFSSDIQQVDIDGSINFSINQSTAMNLYRLMKYGTAIVEYSHEAQSI